VQGTLVTLRVSGPRSWHAYYWMCAKRGWQLSLRARSDQPRVCPRIHAAAELPLWKESPVLHADVDGDGHTDTVGIHIARRANAACAFVLVVETGRRTYAARVAEPFDKLDGTVATWNVPQPFVAALVQLTPHGAQIVVERWAGASVASTNLFGIVGDRLQVLEFPGSYGGVDLDLFGTVGTGDTEARCLRGARLILTFRESTDGSGKRWRYSRWDYALRAARFVRVAVRSAIVPNARLAAADHAWRVDAPTFSGCLVARGRRL
jgi:hypothetical protein